MEKFELNLFSKPESLQFEVKFKYIQIYCGKFIKEKISTINVNIPGEYVNTVRCAAPIYEETLFICPFLNDKSNNQLTVFFF